MKTKNDRLSPGDMRTPADLRDDLEETIQILVNTIGGDGATQSIAVVELSSPQTGSELRFYVLLNQGYSRPIIGSGGINADRLRGLVKTRANVLGSSTQVDVRFLLQRADAPAGLQWKDCA